MRHRWVARFLAVAVLSAAGARAWAGAAVAGKWACRKGGVQVEAELKADGRYAWVYRGPEGEEKESGTYRVAGDALEFRSDAGRTTRMPCRLADPNTLVITDDEGTVYSLARQGAKPPDDPPRALGRIVFSKTHVLRVNSPAGVVPIPRQKLYVMNGDGTGVKPFLTAGDLTEYKQPRWSPDYKWLALTSNHQSELSACMEDIFVVRPDGTGLRRITGNVLRGAPPQGWASIQGTIVDNSKPQADPHTGMPNTRLPMAHTRIYVTAQGAGRYVNPLKPKQGDPPGRYQFIIPRCAAGRIWVKIFVDSHTGHTFVRDVKPGERHVIKEPVKLSVGTFRVSQPSLSPDGQFAVGVASIASQQWVKKAPWSRHGTPRLEEVRSGPDNVAVFRMSDGTMLDFHKATLTSGHFAKEPALSPDGKWIAVSYGNHSVEGLCIISPHDVAAGNPRPRTELIVPPGRTGFPPQNFGVRGPVWSPDGTRLAYVWGKLEAQFTTSEIQVVNRDKTGRRTVATVAPNQLACQPCFSPDGRRIAYTVLTAKTGPRFTVDHFTRLLFTADIHAVALDGTARRRLTTDGLSGEPAWGP